MSNQMQITAVTFKRSKESQKENGVIFNEGSGVIIDMEGKPVPSPVWSWNDCLGLLSLRLVFPD